MKIKVCAVICTLCLLIGSIFTLSACKSNKIVGIEDAKINDDGELVLYYSDGSKDNLGVVVGADGKDGINGKDGVDGKDGADGKDGVDGTNGANGSNGSLVIQNGGNGIPAACAKGLRSAVRIICNFETTVNSGWFGSGNTTTKEYQSEGSGVIYQLDKASGDALVITNYHVVYDASSNSENGISEDINVYLYGSELEEKTIKATYVGGSLYYDIAVLSIDNSDVLKASDACAVDIADSDKVAVGDSAIAIGNAQGYGISASLGIVSVDSEHITMTAADGVTEVSFRVMRVDAAVNSGNSGGGLFDDEGDLIGIVNAKIVYDGVENIGYAIPSNVAVSIADNIIDYCYGTDEERVQRALLGITVQTTDSKAIYDSEKGTMYIEETVLVYEISEGSLAEGILEAGDILVSVTANDKTVKITRQYHIIDIMLDVRAGDTVSLTVLRTVDGTPTEVTVNITITEECLTAY